MATSERSTGVQLSDPTSCAAVSPASLSASQGRDSRKPILGGCGRSSGEPFAVYDPDSSSWRTCRVSLVGEWETFLETYPPSGMTQSGKAYRRQPLAPRTSGTGSSLWPTPQATQDGRTPEQYDAARRRGYEKRKAKGTSLGGPSGKTGQLAVAVQRRPALRAQDGPHGPARGSLGDVVRWPTPASNNGTGCATGLAGGSGNRLKLYKMLGKEEGKKLGCQSLNPYWVEWLMGFPLGWTDLDASETPSSHKSQNGSGGGSCR